MQLNNLNTKFLGGKNLYYDTIDSTQAEIWRLYENDIENGTLIMAGVQTNGKGTHGRTWYTDKINNIAFSFYIKMDCEISKLNGLTLEIAEVITKIFEEKYNINLYIKEPNDIVYKNKKIGGILTEAKVVREHVKSLVIGIGINTSQTEFAEEISEVATSIKKEFDIDVNTQDFIEEFCNKFEKKIIERIAN